MQVPRLALRSLMLACSCLLILGAIFRPVPARADWLQELEAFAVAKMQGNNCPGMAIAIVQNDVPIYVKGFGHLTKDSSSPVDADTVFLIGSTSKAFTSAQIGALVDQKRLAWTDIVSQRLPLFKMSDPWVNKQMQVEDLLCHRSGLHLYSLTLMELLVYPTVDRVRGIRYQQPVSSFRTEFAYQNCMYTSASKLVEAVTGQDWGENLRANIFTPLGMTRSVTNQAAVDQMSNVAFPHLKLEDGSLWVIPPDWFWNYTQDKAMAAAAVRTTAHDMAQWLRFQISRGKLGEKTVVSADSMNFLQSPRVFEADWAQPSADPPDLPYGPASYCCGAWNYWGLSPQPFYFHEGGAMGGGSAIGFSPDAKAGIAVLTNVEAGGDTVATAVVWKFYQLYFGLPPSPVPLKQRPLQPGRVFRPAAPRPAAAQAPGNAGGQPGRPLKSYCGNYYNPAYGTFPVRLLAGGLVMTMGPMKFQATLESQGGDKFLAHLPDYPKGYDMALPAVFQFPSSGPVTLTLGPFSHDPPEVFTRK